MKYAILNSTGKEIHRTNTHYAQQRIEELQT